MCTATDDLQATTSGTLAYNCAGTATPGQLQHESLALPDGVGARMLLMGLRLAGSSFPGSLCGFLGSRHLRQLAQGLLVLGSHSAKLCLQGCQRQARDLLPLAAALEVLRLRTCLHMESPALQYLLCQICISYTMG